MIPTRQTRTGKIGNCFSACLASILEIPLREVPNFVDASTDEQFYENAAKWLASHGLYYVQLKPDDPMLAVMFKEGPIYHTIEGISPRGGMHATVGLNGHMVWDPHPPDGTGRGLAKVLNVGIIGKSFSKGD